MYLAYAYYLYHNPTGQYYYGSRYKNVRAKRQPDEDIWIHYFSSSARIKKLIDEYGAGSFTVSILVESESYDECYWYEQDLIVKNINDPKCINKTYVDRKSGNKMFSMANRQHQESTKQLQSSKTKGKPKNYAPWNKGLTKEDPRVAKSVAALIAGRRNVKEVWNKGLTKENDPRVAKISHTRKEHKIESHFNGKKRGPHSEERKLQASIARKGNKWWNNGVVQTMRKACPEGFVPGKLPRISK